MSEGRSRSANGDQSEGGRLWTGLRNLLFGDEHEQTLREEIEEALDEHQDDAAKPAKPAKVEKHKALSKEKDKAKDKKKSDKKAKADKKTQGAKAAKAGA